MGDRCYLELYCQADQAKELAQMLDLVVDEHQHDPATGATYLFAEQANYGLYEPRLLAATRFNFWGSHGDGAEYGAAAFVALDGKHYDVRADRDGTPLVAYTANGVSELDCAAAAEYHSALATLRARCTGPAM